MVLPISDKHSEYARKVLGELRAGKLRADIDERNEKVNAKIREAQLAKIPYMLVIGDREAESGAVSVRHRKQADLGAKPVDEFVAMISQQVAERTLDS